MKGFNIVLKGESLARWFESRSESQPVREGCVGDDDPTLSDLDEMMADDEDETFRYLWEFGNDGIPGPSVFSEF